MSNVTIKYRGMDVTCSVRKGEFSVINWRISEPTTHEGFVEQGYALNEFFEQEMKGQHVSDTMVLNHLQQSDDFKAALIYELMLNPMEERDE